MTLDALINRILNRRATVEQWMFDAASGKRPMPTPDELRQWALHLGTPGEPPSAPTDAALTDAYADGRKDEREQWEPVARLALAALNSCDGCDSYKGYSQWFGQEQVENAIKALCALICPVCLGAGWVAERPGEQCACGLHSWEARK
jgi:hypothetical protein